MELNAKTKKSDALGNLYRSALFLLKGQSDLASRFLERSSSFLKDKKLEEISSRIKEPLTKKESRLIAEKILDKYNLLRISPSNNFTPPKRNKSQIKTITPKPR